MQNSLFGLVKNYRTISISGMCKNAGKTTALNNLIQNCPAGETLALTSIGRDGENEDLVTGTQKPGIFVREGTMLATASDLLRYCDITKEIIETTGISTPLGEVIMLKALSDGFVQLAGPSIVMQLIGVSQIFREHGAGRIIIDGAVGRKSLCSRALAEATILCTGASLSRSMDEAVAETAHVCNLLMTPEVDEAVRTSCLTDAVRTGKQPNFQYFDGAITDNMLAPMLRKRLPEGFTIVARDASRLLISSASLRKLRLQKAKLAVLERINLTAITINPFSAYGDHFDKEEFLEKMQAAVPVPVINVINVINVVNAFKLT